MASLSSNQYGEPGPWVPGAIAKKIIGLQTILAFCLLCTTFTLIVVVWRLSSVSPRLVTQLSNGQFAALQTNEIKINTDDVINFIYTVLPRLYATTEGQAPGIEELRSLNIINPNIIYSFLSDIQHHNAQLKEGNFTQSAIVQSVNRQTLAIRSQQNMAYAEASGIIILTDQAGKSITAKTQWAMLLYIKPVVDKENSVVNRYGLYLQNFVAQTQGTKNPGAPQPTGEENTPAPGQNNNATPKQSNAPARSLPTANPVQENTLPEAPPITGPSPSGSNPP